MGKTIMVTGNLGYIGSVMVPFLTDEKGYNVIGYDIGYYEDCYLKPAPQNLVKQIKKDVRDCEPEDFAGVDYVIHLAGLSNDPLGDFDVSLTYAINHEGTMKMAKCAKAAGVKRFAYASSQSVYGISDTSKAADEKSPKNPITAYAKTKWICEGELKELCDDSFTVTILRPATAYGASPNLRCDIVFNGFMGYAYTNRLIEIKSDGTPVRPMSHVRDISNAFLAVLEAPADLVKGEVFNIGKKDNNYTVKDLAEMAQRCVPGSRLTFTGEHTDPRSYRVSSEKILTVLKDYYKPEWNIERAGKQILGFFDEIHFDKETFDSWKVTRLKCLKKRIAEGTLDKQLRAVKN